jgi:hypothetical protein
MLGCVLSRENRVFPGADAVKARRKAMVLARHREIGDPQHVRNLCVRTSSPCPARGGWGTQ